MEGPSKSSASDEDAWEEHLQQIPYTEKVERGDETKRTYKKRQQQESELWTRVILM